MEIPSGSWPAIWACPLGVLGTFQGAVGPSAVKQKCDLDQVWVWSLESPETPYLLAANGGWPRSIVKGNEFDPLGLGSLGSRYSLTGSLAHCPFTKRTFPLAQPWPLASSLWVAASFHPNLEYFEEKPTQNH